MEDLLKLKYEFIELNNPYKTKVTLCSLGASMCDIETVDRNGNLESIMLTPMDKEKFPLNFAFYGKTTGRTSGRISGAHYTLNGKEYDIPSFDKNALHGGMGTLAFKEFESEILETSDYQRCIFHYFSKHLEAGFPGNAHIKVIYTLYKNKNALEVRYQAISDLDTLMNLSNHAYFNLSGNIKRNILDHELYMKSSSMLKVEKLVPKEIIPVCEKFSFSSMHKIGKYIMDEEIQKTKGYDFPYFLDDQRIIVKEESSGRIMEVITSYPVCVFYTTNFDSDTITKNGKTQRMYDALCLECMYQPNSINSDFVKEKKDILKKDTLYDEYICYSFEIMK